MAFGSNNTRKVALMIQLGKFVGGGGVVADTNYLYPARWGWINIFILCETILQVGHKV